MGLAEGFRDAGNALNKFSNGISTLNNPNASSQQQEAAVVSIASGMANSLSAIREIFGTDFSGLSTIGGVLNGLNLKEKAIALNDALANGDASAILIASADFAASVAGVLGSFPSPFAPEAKALSLLLSAIASMLKNGESVSEIINNNPFFNIPENYTPSAWSAPGPDLSIPRNQRTPGGFQGARTAATRRDPLALDLDGDGLETTGITAYTQVLFDHDGDGIRTGTGWLKGDDAFLALDKNGNGTIDNGNELFGVDTVMSNGQKAANGFAALADLDSNHDGVFNSLDDQFANVLVWRDLNQDGISETGELQSLTEAGIASINLTSTATNTNLGNGNVMSAAGTFTKTNGTTGTAGDFATGTTGNLNLASNPFYRQFTDTIPLTAEAAELPNMQGAGALRDLREAASLNAALVTDVNSLAGTTRRQMMAKLDTLLQHWADSSPMQTSADKIAAMADPLATLSGNHPHLLFKGS